MSSLYELKQNLKIKKIDNLYIFFGPEVTILNTYIDKISSITNKQIRKVESVDSIIHSLRSINIFKSSFIYVIRDDKGYTSSSKAWELLKANTGNNIVILIYASLDKRTKFYNFHSQFIVEFQKLSQEVLVKHVKKDYELSERNAVRLVNRCDEDYGKIKLVGTKLSILAEIEHTNIDRIFDIAIEDNLIPISNTNLTYDFLDSVILGDIDKAWFLLDVLKKSGEPTIKLLGMLYNNIRSLMLVQSCPPKSNIGEKTGLDGWLIRKMKDFCGEYSTGTLARGLGYIRDSEKGMKVGEVEEDIALENCLVNLFFDYIYN
jgi:DNA polymerase III delta subunit